MEFGRGRRRTAADDEETWWALFDERAARAEEAAEFWRYRDRDVYEALGFIAALHGMTVGEWRTVLRGVDAGFVDPWWEVDLEDLS